MKWLSRGDYFTEKEWNNVREYYFGPIQVKGITDAEKQLIRVYGGNPIKYAYQIMHHEKMVEMCAYPLDVGGHIRKMLQYGLSRNTHMGAGIVTEYDENIFEGYKRAFDARCESSAT
jgi:hypothetical protein